MDFLGGPPARTGYHGGERDARYPSPRRLRNAIANTVDIAIIVAVFSVTTWYVIGSGASRDHPWWVAALGVALAVINLANVVVLPGLAGGSVGQLVTGLVRIRGADGTRPTVRQNGRAYFRTRGLFRIGGVHSDAPEFVVVRRQDAVAVADASSARVTGSYLEH